MNAELAKISYVIQNSQVQFSQLTDELIATKNQVGVALQQYDHVLQKIRNSVQELIKQHESAYFDNSTNLYQDMQDETPKYILQRIQHIDSVKKLQLRGRLQTYTDWKHPGLIIRPAHSPWVEDLVALDPMYFVDTHVDLIAPATSQFPPEYQRRLRCYVIDEFANTPIFEKLPQQQFGFVYGFENTRLITIVLMSWGLALFEYCFQVPANRLGYEGNSGPFSLLQLKVIQEVITLVIFVIFSLLFFKNESLRWNHFIGFVF